MQVHNRLGLTLIELIITLVLVSLLLLTLTGFFNAGLANVFSQVTRSGAKGESGRAMNLMAQELRQAASMASAAQTNFSITRDTDNNGVDETIQYSWSGAAGQPLNRVSGSTSAIANSVGALSFSYYDGSANLLSFPVTASQVRLVGIQLTLTKGDETFVLRSQVRLRNL